MPPWSPFKRQPRQSAPMPDQDGAEERGAGPIARPSDTRAKGGDTLPRLRDALLALDGSEDRDRLPERGDSLPQRGGSLPQRGDSLPQRGDSLPQREDSLPQRAEALPQRGDSLPQRGADALPVRGADSLPQREGSLPQREGSLPQRGDSLPQREGSLPQREGSLPQRGDSLPLRGGSLPQRGSQGSDGPEALPRRTTRTRPAGRHRSPHRLSVASDAPALVLAVPGSAEADTAEIGPRVASIASLSCPGVEIRVGYVDGKDLSLVDCVLPAGPDSDEDQFPSVIVPLLLGPSPSIDASVRRIATLPAVQAVVASYLGPHPLVAEALHVRLAEAGLARHARSSGLSIAADGRGVIVLADKDEQAASAAAVAAVLLASRLSVPVVPASLGDPASIADAVTRLTESGSPRPALAPCLIGPETSLPVLDDLSAALGAPASATLGAHQAVGPLVAIRYGAALASLSLAG